jgi:hypothetical protein
MKAKDYVLKFVSRKLGFASACLTGILTLPDLGDWRVVAAKIAALGLVCVVFLRWQGKVDERKVQVDKG